jgi:hypothetical protein
MTTNPLLSAGAGVPEIRLHLGASGLPYGPDQCPATAPAAKLCIATEVLTHGISKGLVGMVVAAPPGNVSLLSRLTSPLPLPSFTGFAGVMQG